MIHMKRNVLITGGLGFMGSNFIRFLYNKYPDYRIWNYDLMTYAGNPENLKDIIETETAMEEKRYFFIKGDICDPEAVTQLFQQAEFDFIVNFAAESHVDRSLVNSAEFLRSNIMGVHTLINAVRQFSHARFVQISTDEIYGDMLDGVKSDENHPIRPSNPYAASKAAADILVQSYIRTYGLQAVIVRGSNNFGPYQYPEKIIPLAITNLIQNKLVPIHGSGKQIRTWIHVDDFCEGLDIAVHQAPVASIYNIAGAESNIIEIVERVAQILNVDRKKKFTVHVNDRPGQDMRYSPDSSKLTLLHGWQTKKSIIDHLPEVVEWYLKNEAWWLALKAQDEYIQHYEKQCLAQYY